LRWYDAAGRLTPAERDVVIGRARVLRKARRVNAAIAAYHSWLAVHPADAEARQEVAPLRAAAAAAVSAHVGGSGDSDGNSSIRAGVVAESPLLGPVRLGVVAGRDEVHDAAYTARLRQLHVRSTWQLGTRLRIESALGATFMDQLAAPAETTLFPTTPGRGRGAADRSRALASGQIRARWRNPAGSALLDLRGQHGLLSATPRLLASEVKRSEVRALVQVPALRPIALRGMGRAARLSALEGINYRTGVGAGMAVLGPAGELSATVHEIRYARPSAAPYASPRLAQLVEAGSYLELERGAWTVALDIGAGLQRRADHGASLGKWVRALRAYALAIARLAPGREVRLELEAEDSPLSNEAAVGAGWRYASASLALRWAIH
jgi:hypothetical protein